MQLPSITYEGGRTLVHHHQPPGGRCDAGSQASPSAPTTAANRHQRRLASFPFSSLEMIDWSSPHSLPRWRCVSPARQRALRTDSPIASMPFVDSDGRPSIEPRTNLGYAVGVYTSLSYTIALHPRSTAAHLALAPAPNRPRCREVASDMPGSCIAGRGGFPESRLGRIWAGGLASTWSRLGLPLPAAWPRHGRSLPSGSGSTRPVLASE